MRLGVRSATTWITQGHQNRRDLLAREIREEREVPVTMAVFPKKLPIPPRSLVERGYNILCWTAMPRGGHFAPMEHFRPRR